MPDYADTPDGLTIIDFEHDDILGGWFVPFKDGDWLCAVWRDKEGAFCVRHRFRYYTESPVDRDDDEKYWHNLRDEKSGRSDADQIAKMAKIAMEFAAGSGTSADFVDMRTAKDADERWALLVARPWCHERDEPDITSPGSTGTQN